MWSRLCFGGIVPDHVAARLVKAKDREVWSGLRAKMYECRTLALPPWDKRKCSVLLDTDTAACAGAKLAPGDSTLMYESSLKWCAYVDAQIAPLVMSGKSLPRHLTKTIEHMYPQCSKELADRTKIPVRLALEVVCASKDPQLRRFVCLLLKRAAGFGAQGLVALIMAYCTMPQVRRPLDILLSCGFMSRGLLYWAESLKGVHTWVRSAGSAWCPPLGLNDVDEPAETLMYIHLACGRYYHPTLSATEEITKRTEASRPARAWTKMSGWSSSAFESLFDDQVNMHVANMTDGKEGLRSLTPDQVIAKAAQLGTGGSASELRKMKLVYEGEQSGPSQPGKGLWLSRIHPDALKTWLVDHTAMLRGTGIDKYEWGKLRLLLPGPIVHWLVESMVLAGTDDHFYANTDAIAAKQSGIQELVAQCRKILRFTQGHSLSVDSDFADFNYLHTFDRMRRVWLKLANVLDPSQRSYLEKWEGHDFRVFSAKCARWTAAALSSVWARGKMADSEFQELVQGLWSGWRSTSFINCLFNVCYQGVVSRVFRELYGYSPLVELNTMGDDMDGVPKTEWAGMRYLQLIELCNLDAQAEKQLSSRTRTEFLRIMSSSSGAKGSMWRALGGLISSDGQSPSTRSSPETARGINESLNTLIRRGADIESIERVRYTIVSYWSTATCMGPDQRLRVVKPPTWLIRLQQSEGGFGCVRFGEGPQTAEKPLPPRPKTTGPLQMPRELLQQYGIVSSQLAVSDLAGRVHALGGTLTRAEKLVELHSSGLIGSALHPGFARKREAAANASLVELFTWAHALGNVELVERKAEDWAIDIAKRSVDQVLRCVWSGAGIDELEDPCLTADLIRSVALGSMSSVGQAVSHIKGMGSMGALSICSALGGDAVSTRTQSLLCAVPAATADAMVGGGVVVPMPIGGVAAGALSSVCGSALRHASVILHSLDCNRPQVQDLTELGYAIGCVFRQFSSTDSRIALLAGV